MMSKLEFLKLIQRISFPVLLNKWTAILIFSFIVLASGWIVFTVEEFSDLEALSNKGSFGDFINGVTAPFIGLISVGLTMLVLYKQSQHQNNSSFQLLFTEMINLLNKTCESMQIEKGKKVPKIFRGKDVFTLLFKEYSALYKGKKRNTQIDEKTAVQEAFKSLHSDLSNKYDYYFKIIYNILKLIDQKCPVQERELYAGLLRSVLSIDEEKFLFYDAFGLESFQKFKKLVEKYHMLHDLKEVNLLNDSHKSFYDPSAFD